MRFSRWAVVALAPYDYKKGRARWIKRPKHVRGFEVDQQSIAHHWARTGISLCHDLRMACCAVELMASGASRRRRLVFVIISGESPQSTS